MPAPLPRVNVSARDEMSMCARSVYMSVCVGGLQEGGGCADTGGGHSIYIPTEPGGGSVVIMRQHPGGINSLLDPRPLSPTTITKTQAESTTIRRLLQPELGEQRKKPAAASRCLERELHAYN